MSAVRKTARIPTRSAYTVKNLLSDIKKLKLTPSTLYTIGTEILYYEWTEALEDLGKNDEVTVYLEELLNFMQTDYERRLLQGELRREKETPIEFQSYVLKRPGPFIQGVLQAMYTRSEREIERHRRAEQGIRRDLEKNPKDAELWNQLRLTLWVLGKYDEASEAYKKAKKLGWEKSKSRTVGI
jgi:tetratricopeptide (TPR) repeat protein